MAVMGLIILVPVLPGMMAHFRDVPGVDYLIPLMLTLPALCVALLSPVAGVVVDFFGRRKTCIGALVIYAGVGILPIFLQSLIEMSLGVAIGAITFAGSLIAFAKLNGNMSGAPIRNGSPTRPPSRRSRRSSSLCSAVRSAASAGARRSRRTASASCSRSR